MTPKNATIGCLFFVRRHMGHNRSSPGQIQLGSHGSNGFCDVDTLTDHIDRNLSLCFRRRFLSLTMTAALRWPQEPYCTTSTALSSNWQQASKMTCTIQVSLLGKSSLQFYPRKMHHSHSSLVTTRHRSACACFCPLAPDRFDHTSKLRPGPLNTPGFLLRIDEVIDSPLTAHMIRLQQSSLVVPSNLPESFLEAKPFDKDIL